MGQLTTVFFDLDGTLTDPGEGITNAVSHALRAFGIQVADRRTLYPFIGPPLLDSFQRYYGFTLEQARQGVRLYREYYADRGLFENAVYPGIPEALDALRSAGLKLVMATGKPETFALRIAEKFGIADRFDCIAGASLDETRIRKADVLRYAMARSGVTDPAEGLMVGDREHDVFGAQECGMACMGVLYGYGSREELAAAGAAYLAETVADLCAQLLALRGGAGQAL